MPGVQMPHCAPPHSRKACWTGCRPRIRRRRPSMVQSVAPSACSAGTRQLLTSSPFMQDGAGAALAFAAAFFGAGEVQVFAQNVEQALHGIDRHRVGLAIDGERDVDRSRDWLPLLRRCADPNGLLRRSVSRSSARRCLREQRNRGEVDAGGVLDGVEDGWGGAIHGQLADALGAEGAVDGRGPLRRDTRSAGGPARWA